MAQKKFFTKEVKIGISFILALTILIVGINFLKGINLFTPTNHYILQYDKIDGLVVSNGVYINGYKIGQVREIKYDYSQAHPFTIDITINKDIQLPQGTIAYLFDESIMGGKGIDLSFSDNTQFHVSGDTLITDVQPGLLASLGTIIPSLQSTISHADSLIVSAENLINSEEINHSLKEIKKITTNLNTTVNGVNRILNNELPGIMHNLDSISADIKVVTTNLKDVNLKDIALSIDTAINGVQNIVARVNYTEGTIGALINDRSMYNNINNTINSANALLIDLKANPKRYVNITVFGKKEK